MRKHTHPQGKAGRGSRDDHWQKIGARMNSAYGLLLLRLPQPPLLLPLPSLLRHSHWVLRQSLEVRNHCGHPAAPLDYLACAMELHVRLANIH